MIDDAGAWGGDGDGDKAHHYLHSDAEATFFCRVLRGNVCFECLQERVTQVRYTNAVM